MDNTVKEDARSEEHLYDKKFIKRWADRCFEIYKKSGQKAANEYAKSFFSKDLLKEVNAEIASRM